MKAESAKKNLARTLKDQKETPPLPRAKKAVGFHGQNREKAVIPTGGKRVPKRPKLDLPSMAAAAAFDSPAALNYLSEWERENYPGRFFVPNYGQEKAIKPLQALDLIADRSIIGCFTGGNAVGKTTLLCIALLGICLGRRQLNPFYHDWNVFQRYEEVRDQEKRHVFVRLICHKTSMMEDGNLYQSILKWFPKGWMTWSKNQMSYYSSCDVRDPIDGKLLARIQVRTFDQDTIAHAGDTLDAVLVDEPMPKHLFQENVSRLRTKRGGILWLFCTPLDVGGWMKDYLEDSDDAVFTSASIWDNCVDWHPDPALWSGGEIGKGYVLTRGHLKRNKIDDLIKQWRKEGVEVALSRETGKFTHLAGAIVKEFDEATHVIEPFQIPANWPIYCVMDPHFGSKPNCISWWAHAPDDDLYLVAEWPPRRWDESQSGESIEQAALNIRGVEAPFRSQVMKRWADPAIAKQHIGGDPNKTYHTEFLKQRLVFLLANNDPALGMSELRRRMYFDKLLPTSEFENKPKMRFFSRNPWTGAPLQNAKLAMTMWTYKKGMESRGSDISFTTSVTDRWKDPADTCRYVSIMCPPWRAAEAEVLDGGLRPTIRRKARTW